MPEDPKAALVARLNTLASQMQQQQVANAPISPAQLKELRDITAAVSAYEPPPPDPLPPDPQDVPDPETGITPRDLAEMGWPMTGEPVADPSEPDPA